jgi:hypothetical protein
MTDDLHHPNRQRASALGKIAMLPNDSLDRAGRTMENQGFQAMSPGGVCHKKPNVRQFGD